MIACIENKKLHLIEQNSKSNRKRVIKMFEETNSLNTPDTLEAEPITFWTAAEVANIFFQGKINYAKVLRMTRNGDLPAVKRGKSYLYLRSALITWANKSFNKPAWAQKSHHRKQYQ